MCEEGLTVVRQFQNKLLDSFKKNCQTASKKLSDSLKKFLNSFKKIAGQLQKIVRQLQKKNFYKSNSLILFLISYCLLCILCQ